MHFKKVPPLIFIYLLSMSSIYITSLSCTISNYFQKQVTSFEAFGNSDASQSLLGMKAHELTGCLKTTKVFKPKKDFELLITFQVDSIGNSAINDGIAIWIAKQSTICDYNQDGGYLYYNNLTNLIIFEYDLYNNGNLNDDYDKSMNIKSCLNEQCSALEIPSNNNIQAPNLVSKLYIKLYI